MATACALDHVSLDLRAGRTRLPARAIRLRQDHAAPDRRRRRAPDLRPRAARRPGGRGPDSFVPPEKRGVGLMFQDYALFPHLTILQNVAFGLRSLRQRRGERRGAAALARVGLEHYANEYPHILSGGEQQRVALARSIAPRPGVLLMDEPFSNLDRACGTRSATRRVAILRETGATTIVVTHDPEEAMRIADRVVLMREGRIVQAGQRADLYRAPGHPRRAHLLRFERGSGPSRTAAPRRCLATSRPQPRRRQGRHRLRAPARRPAASRRRRHSGAGPRPPLPRRRGAG